jgi:hypothetical protein
VFHESRAQRMNNQVAQRYYTAEQKQEWDKLTGPGLYQVEGPASRMYVGHRVARCFNNPDDPKTVLLIGSQDDAVEFLQMMVDCTVIDSVACHEPKFFWFQDREYDDEYVSRSLQSEMDAERFRNFIATSVEKLYYPIAAVVVLDAGWFEGKLPHLDKILNVPVFDKGRLIKTIKPEVFQVFTFDTGDTSFTKDCGDVASIDWRKDTSTFIELPQEKPVMLVEHLIPEKALTVMAAPSYTGKTHIAIEVGLALATARNFLDHFKGPAQPVPVIYHVPELHASLFRSFMQRLGAEERLKDCQDNFLIRTLERDLWPLDSPQMVDSSRGRYVFLDTFGYFNDGDDSASYTQAIEFAKKVNHLIREGCLGVCGLYHPPKYSKDKKATGNVMTLENQILGSAGYGGVLRSCLAMRSLHEDSNRGLWVYVQGVKNPGLEGPFQIEGVPLKLVKRPGESPYLSELLKGTSSKAKALAMLNEGKKRDEICKTLRVSPNTLSKWKQEEIFDSNEGDESND